MTDQNEKLTPGEVLLSEIRQSEEAGVFRSTPLDCKALLNSEREPEVPWIYRHRVVTAAAAVLMAVGLWAAMFAMQLGDVQRSRVVRTSPAQTDAQVASATIQECVAGPSGTLSPACQSFDTDTDGDVDLADIRSFQVAFNR